MARKSALGRGLASLIPVDEPSDEKRSSPPSPSSDPGASLHFVSVACIKPGRHQPRTDFDSAAIKELSESIREQGILQPLIARRHGDHYELIAGERRLRAAIDAGLDTVPLVVREVDDAKSLELALVENIQRDELNPVELARAFQALQDEFNYTHDEISKKVGRNRSTITNHLRLLKLSTPVLDALSAQRITMGHARALLGLSDEKLQIRVLERILERGLSVRQTEALIRRHNAPPPTRRSKELNPDEKAVVDRLRTTYQTKVEISAKRSGEGEIRIAFHDKDDLNRIIEILLHSPT